MKDKSLRVLIVEDSEDDAHLIIRELKKGGYNPVYERVETAAAMKKAIHDKPWDIILCDYNLPEFNAPSAIALLKEANVDIPLLAVTGTIGEETAAECMRLGAQDYIPKGNLSRLCPAIARELEDAKVRNEQMKADEALRKASLDWQITFDATSDAICLLDTDQRILRCNRTMAEMFGMKQKEIVGRYCWEIIHGTMEPIPECPVTRMKGSLVREKMDLQRGDMWFSVTADPIVDETRTIQGVVHIVRDITESKKAAEALSESEYKYKSLIENIPDIIFTIDLEGKITFVSKRTKEILGYDNAETLSRNIFDFIPAEDHQRALENLKRGMKGEKIKHFQVPMIAKSGERLFFECSFSRIYKDGAVVGAQGTAIDITERKKADEALRESEGMLQESQRIAGLGSYVLDIPTGIFKTSKVMDDVLGIDETYDHSINGWAALIHPDDRAMVFDYLFNEVIGRKQTADKEYRIVRFNNKAERWLHALGKLEFDDNGLPIKLQGTTQDITERRKAEEKIKNSELKYRNIFENAVEGIYQSTIEGRFVTANAAFAHMAGYDSPEELITSIKDIGTQLYVHPEDRKRFIEIRDAKGFVDGFEVEFYKKDGSKFWVVVNARTVKDEQGKIICMEGLIEDITIRRHAEEQLHQTLESLRKAVGTTIQVLVTAIESRDPYTAGHQLRVADLAGNIAMEMGFPQEKIEGIRMAGSIHDIGKLSIPAETLVKPTKLTNIEFSLIKEHAKCGYEMLKDVESPWPLAEIVYQHHERMNGTGYPRNLKGDNILIEARIMAVADVVEAMASHRPYRPALGIEEALEEIEKNKGILYDNVVADSCLRLFREKGYHLA
ncbi:MAG: PAS domain S-box protein [Smithella sp.]